MPEKLLIITPSLAGGGAERLTVLLLQHLNRDLFTPELVMFHDVNEYSPDVLKDITVHRLNKRSRFDFIFLVFELHKIIKKENYHIVFSSMTYANYINVLARYWLRSGYLYYLSEQNNVSFSLNQERLRKLKKLMIKYLYPKSHKVVCVSHGVKSDLVNNFGISPNKCKVIYNSVDIHQVRKLVSEEIEHPWFSQDVPVFVACGRLTYQKNYPLLFRAVAIASSQTKIRLMLLGKGEEERLLKDYAISLGIAEQVAFLGFQQNPFKYMARATGFVLSSLFEGLPMVIIEAMACETPVISTRCPFGPEEIISDEVNGLLVPVEDAEKLAETMIRLINDEDLRSRLAEAGKNRADDFDVKKIVMEYENLFINTLER
jgi:glycosyltransferase involved in cell wall biosynthesis